MIQSSTNCVNTGFLLNESPLHCAVRINSFPKCNLLMKYQASLAIKWRDMTPVELAYSLRCSKDIIDLLHVSTTTLSCYTFDTYTPTTSRVLTNWFGTKLP